MKHIITTTETTTWEVDALDEASAREALVRWCKSAQERWFAVTTAEPDDDAWTDEFGIQLRQTNYGAEVRP